MGRPPSIPSRNQQDPGQAGQGSASSRSGKGALTFARSLAAAALSTSPKRALGHPHSWVWVLVDFQEGGTCLQPFLTPGQTWVYTSFDFTVPSLT